MSEAVVKYDLSNQNDKIEFESAANGHRYRRVLQKLICSVSTSNGVLTEIRSAAAAEGLFDIRDHIDQLLKARG